MWWRSASEARKVVCKLTAVTKSLGDCSTPAVLGLLPPFPWGRNTVSRSSENHCKWFHLISRDMGGLVDLWLCLTVADSGGTGTGTGVALVFVDEILPATTAGAFTLSGSWWWQQWRKQ